MTPYKRARGRCGLAPTAVAMSGKTVRTFARTPQLVGATVGQGILFLFVFRYVFGGAIDSGILSYIDYMTPGILTATILFAAAGAAVGVAEDKNQGFTERVLSLPTSRSGVVIGRAAADTAIVALATAAALLAAIVVGFRPNAPLLSLAAASGLLGLYALTASAAFGALGGMADSPQTAQTFGFLAIPLTFISSAYVPTSTMPGWLSAVADHQPVTVMIDAVRHLVHADVLGPASREVWAALVWATLITALSLLASRGRLARRRAPVERRRHTA